MKVDVDQSVKPIKTNNVSAIANIRGQHFGFSSKDFQLKDCQAVNLARNVGAIFQTGVRIENLFICSENMGT